MRSYWAVFIGLLMLSPAAEAQQRQYLDVTGWNLGDGDYHIKVENGVASLVGPFVLIPVTPQPGPGPMPPPQTDLRKASRDAANTINQPATARDLALTLTTMDVLAQEGIYSSGEAYSAACSAAIDKVLEDRGQTQAWVPWKSAVGEIMTRMAQDGDLQSLSDYRGAYDQMNLGLQDSFRDAELDSLDIADVLEIVQLVIEAIQGEFNLETILKIVLKVLDILTEQGMAVTG